MVDEPLDLLQDSGTAFRKFVTALRGVLMFWKKIGRTSFVMLEMVRCNITKLKGGEAGLAYPQILSALVNGKDHLRNECIML